MYHVPHLEFDSAGAFVGLGTGVTAAETATSVVMAGSAIPPLGELRPHQQVFLSFGQVRHLRAGTNLRHISYPRKLSRLEQSPLIFGFHEVS